MDEKHWKVGELARATGLTVRTLHHWDELGLLRPSERSSAGYRLYSAADVARLYRVAALRSLGLSLHEVGAAIDGAADLRELVRRQLEALDRRMELEAELRRRLVRVLESGGSGDLLETMEAMTMIERHYTPEQLADLEERARALGPDGMEQAQRDWAELIEAMEAERRAGSDPAGPRVQELAARWSSLVAAFTGGNESILRSLERMYEEEGPEHASRGALTGELAEFVQRACRARDGAA
jgi:DNA-binding transcriptional MerR regulator